jgi:hypothetical protein
MIVRDTDDHLSLFISNEDGSEVFATGADVSEGTVRERPRRDQRGGSVKGRKLLPGMRRGRRILPVRGGRPVSTTKNEPNCTLII